MRWFKHMTTAREDQSLVGLRRELGMAGYGRYWAVLEAVAGRSKDDAFELTLSIQEWSGLLETNRKNCLTWFQLAANLSLLEYQADGNWITVAVPKLRKIRDEYSRKSRHTRDECPDKHREPIRTVEQNRTDTEESRTEEEKKRTQCRAGRADSTDVVREVFDYWQRVCGHPGAKLGSDRKTKITARLREGYTIDQLKRAVDGCKRSPHHQGENDRGTIFDDIELICRDSKHVEMFIGLAEGRKGSTDASYQRFVAKLERREAERKGHGEEQRHATR